MRKAIQAFVLTFLTYLLQVCVMPYFAVFTTVPNLAFSVMAVATVVYSRFVTFGIVATLGILFEVMAPGLPGMNVVLYPALGFLGSILFSDKTERRIEQEIAAGKPGKNRNPLLRTMFCSLFLSFASEAVYMVYAYLTGAEFTFMLFMRSLWSILYTLLVTMAIMIPLRHILGVNKRLRKRTLQEN